MLRCLSVASVAVAVVLLVNTGDAGGKKAVNNQMVRGTIKLADPSKSLLVINQKVKSEFVDRELSILDTTEFVVMTPSGKKEARGDDGLRLLEGGAGATVAVKCDKDVNVLKVTVTLKK